MSVSPVLAPTRVLEACNVPNPLVLRLSGASGASESEHEPVSKPVPTASRQPVIVNGKLLLNSRRIYKCTIDGCERSYTKPSRLEEHERSHAGDRPFVCKTCNKSYLRETHLQAHQRSHLPQSDRPFVCGESDCPKRFWTAQHLKAHKEVIHHGEKPFKCADGRCAAAFLKHHQLRAHMASEHAPPGTKPYQCDKVDCAKSFSTNQKLRAHLKVHEEKRYACVDPACRMAPESAFCPTWTALQQHIRTTHPPTCFHEECGGKSFSSQKGLRAHLKLHEQQSLEDVLSEYEDHGSEDDAPSRKRRRGREVRGDWKCEVEGCAKDFRSKKALTTHHAITHLGRRDFVCAVEGCGRAFGYKHILQRHQARRHGNDRSEAEVEGDCEQHEDADEESSEVERVRCQHKKRKTRRAQSPDVSIINEITGVAYEERAAEVQAPLKCPHPVMEGLASALPTGGHDIWDDVAPCEYVFGRAYDLRRHVLAVHGVVLEKEVVDAWARRMRLA
ncbi:hypothetical protein F5148DRAFT_1379203 [Russula earlei]|uniref:Uncharacterized protein n=1 Tax=Russula earlei TaxID=71964 RepID=A0ACC0TUQ7_9AGAM|nr:hypothetical protein F5148DRAFT_1379203 [Russula earlei]